MAYNQQGLLDQGIHHALSNDLILEKAFNHLDLENIKKVRLVCKTWSNEATRILGTKTILNIFKMLDDTESTTVFQMDPYLVKNIHIDFYDRTCTVVADALKLISFLTENHTFVHQLRFRRFLMSDNFQLFTHLQGLIFPTLEKIDIEVKLDKIPRAIIPTDVTAVQTWPNLRHIKIHLQYYQHLRKEMERIGAEGYDFQIEKLFLQNLINSAPNLNYFEYTPVPFHLDLSQCNFIKRAQLNNIPGFGIDQLEVMLQQMSSSLEDLSMKIEIADALKRPILNKASFPKLRKLTVDEPWEFMKLINPNGFPKLKSIAISGRNAEYMKKYISSFGIISVKSVTLSNLILNSSEIEYGFLPLKEVKSVFPNVTEFIHKQKRMNLDCATDIKFAKHLEALLRICNEQKIDSLDVIAELELFPGSYYYIPFITVVELKYLYHEDAQSIKSLEWRCGNVVFSKGYDLSLIGTEEDAEMLMNILLLTKNMTSVVIQNMFLFFKHKEELWTRICTFVKDHELPVHFFYTTIS